MIPQFKDLFEEIHAIFHPTNQDVALLNLLSIYSSNYTSYDPYLDHNTLQNWISRGLTKSISEDIVNGRDNSMINFINRLNDDEKEKLITALKIFDIKSNTRNIGRKINEVIKDIARYKKNLPTSAEIRCEKEHNFDILYGSRIIISQKKRCACCNEIISLRNTSNNKIYKNYHIVEIVNTKPKDFKNLIALCSKECYIEYLDNYDTEMLNDFLLKKEQYIKNDEISKVMEDNEIDQQINTILEKVKINYATYSIEPQEKYDVTKIKAKIQNKNLELYHRIKQNCDLSFGYISKLLKLLDLENNDSYKRIREQVHKCFLDFDKLGLDQMIIYNNLTRWLLEESELDDNYSLAAERIISFFVQICEVFYEISE